MGPETAPGQKLSNFAVEQHFQRHAGERSRTRDAPPPYLPPASGSAAAGSVVEVDEVVDGIAGDGFPDDL